MVNKILSIVYMLKNTESISVTNVQLDCKRQTLQLATKTKNRVRVIHGKRVIGVRVTEVSLYNCIDHHYPANTQRRNNVVTTSLQRRDVAAAL